MRVARIPALLLALALLGGCGAAEKTPEPTAAPTAQPTRLSPQEELLAALPADSPAVLSGGEEHDIYAALRHAWDTSYPDAPAWDAQPDARSENGGDMICREGEWLYILRGKHVAVVKAEGGELSRETFLEAGFEWYESGDENAWGGCEKSPAELYVCNGRLAVVSDWYEYHNYAGEDGEWRYEDMSHTCLDIYDITTPAQPRLVASYGQEGYQCAGMLLGESVVLVSRRALYDGDCREEEAESYLPALYHGGERQCMDAAGVKVVDDCELALYTLVSVYDLQKGVRAATTALVGSGELVALGEDGLYLMSRRGQSAELTAQGTDAGGAGQTLERVGLDIFRFALTEESVELQAAACVAGLPRSVESISLRDGALHLLLTEERRYYTRTRRGDGSVESTLEEAQRSSRLLTLDEELKPAAELELEAAEEITAAGFAGALCWFETAAEPGVLQTADLAKTRRKVTRSPGIDGVPAYLAPWDGENYLALSFAPDGVTMALSLLERGADGTLAPSAAYRLGYDFQAAPEEPQGIFLSAALGLAGLPAEDGYALFTYRPDTGFAHLRDIYSWDYSGNQRLLSWDGYLYVADRDKINVFRAEDLAFLQEWYI